MITLSLRSRYGKCSGRGFPSLDEATVVLKLQLVKTSLPEVGRQTAKPRQIIAFRKTGMCGTIGSARLTELIRARHTPASDMHEGPVLCRSCLSFANTFSWWRIDMHLCNVF